MFILCPATRKECRGFYIDFFDNQFTIVNTSMKVLSNSPIINGIFVSHSYRQRGPPFSILHLCRTHHKETIFKALDMFTSQVMVTPSQSMIFPPRSSFHLRNKPPLTLVLFSSKCFFSSLLFSKTAKQY